MHDIWVRDLRTCVCTRPIRVPLERETTKLDLILGACVEHSNVRSLRSYRTALARIGVSFQLSRSRRRVGE